MKMSFRVEILVRVISIVTNFTRLGLKLMGLIRSYRKMIAAGAVFLAFLPFPIRAELTTVDFNLPIAQKQGSNFSAAGNVPLGTPMHMSFSYDPDFASIGATGNSLSYYFSTNGAHASLTIGDVSWEMPSLTISISHNGITETAEGVRRADIAVFYAFTGTINPQFGDPYGTANALLLWPTGTFQDFSPILPSLPPSIEFLAADVGTNDGVDENRAAFESSEYPYSSLSAVPEPATYGLFAVPFLSVLVGLRSKRSRKAGKTELNTS
jgi:hypothetical protein